LTDDCGDEDRCVMALARCNTGIFTDDDDAGGGGGGDGSVCANS